jgi:hypothetical protein
MKIQTLLCHSALGSAPRSKAACHERHLGRPVDLLVLNQTPVDLIHRVLRDGILIHYSNPSARICFEVKARNEYFDLLPYLWQYRRATQGASL